MRALCEERQRNLGVFVGGHDHRDGVTGRAEFVERGEPPAMVSRANFLRALIARLIDARELRAGQGRIDARMMLPQRADASDAAADRAGRRSLAFRVWSFGLEHEWKLAGTCPYFTTQNPKLETLNC